LRAVSAVQRGDYDAAIASALNDFEPVVSARYPAVSEVLAALRAAGAAAPMLSGSGGACFTLERDETHARAVAARLAVPAGARSFIVPLAPTAAWRTPTPA
jgi:4-diphosphocytidyl-2C-methyl-D-erythritol kinase